MSVPVHRFDLDGPDRTPLSELRAKVRRVLAHLHPDVVADAELVVTELATNAFEHARAPWCAKVSLPPGAVRIEVDDAAPDALPRPGTSTLGALRGRGMLMVQAISSEWGVLRRPGGKTVWAQLPA